MKIILCLLLLLVAVGFGADEKPLTPEFLTSTDWRYDQPNVKNRSLRFRKDGSCEATTWKGLWKIVGDSKIEITLHDKRTATLAFDVKTNTYTGTGFDGMTMTGARKGQAPASSR